MLNDHRQAWDMRPDGSYVQRQPAAEAAGPEALGTHRALMELTKSRGQEVSSRWPISPSPEI